MFHRLLRRNEIFNEARINALNYLVSLQERFYYSEVFSNESM